MKIRHHLALVLLAYLGMGVSIAIQILGVKAGMNPDTVFRIFFGCIIFYSVIILTSFEKVKRVVLTHDEKESKIKS